MHPLLFKIGSVPIHTYGVLIAIGFLIGMYLVRTLSERSGLNAEKSIDLAFIVVLAGFVGARLLYVLTRWDYFVEYPGSIFRVWEGGLVFYGGPIASIAVGAWLCRKYKFSVWKVMDVYIPALVVAHAFGRLGCLGAGCCYGKPTDLPWALRFDSSLVDAHLRGIPLHPTQLYEGVSLFILFWGLMWVFKNKKFDGQVGLTYLVVYPVLRSVVEVFRGDMIRGFIIEDVLSTSQFISALVFLGALFLLYQRSQGVVSEPLPPSKGKGKKAYGR